jgi:hypothetical protein
LPKPLIFNGILEIGLSADQRMLEQLADAALVDCRTMRERPADHPNGESR